MVFKRAFTPWALIWDTPQAILTVWTGYSEPRYTSAWNSTTVNGECRKAEPVKVLSHLTPQPLMYGRV